MKAIVRENKFFAIGLFFSIIVTLVLALIMPGVLHKISHPINIVMGAILLFIFCFIVLREYLWRNTARRLELSTIPDVALYEIEQAETAEKVLRLQHEEKEALRKLHEEKERKMLEDENLLKQKEDEAMMRELPAEVQHRLESIKRSGLKVPNIADLLRTKNMNNSVIPVVSNKPAEVKMHLVSVSQEIKDSAIVEQDHQRVNLTEILQTQRQELEDYFIDFPKVTFEDSEARIYLHSYILALGQRLTNLGISLTDDQSYSEADILQTKGDTRTMPFIDPNYLDPEFSILPKLHVVK